jgi:hypothetical protein
VAVDGEGGAEAPFAGPADGEGAEGPAAAVTLAACLEPKWLIRYFRKRSFFPPYVRSCSQAMRPHFARPKRVFHPSEGAMQAKAQLAPLSWGADGLSWGADGTLEFRLNSSDLKQFRCWL